jgi:hypothetical protein
MTIRAEVVSHFEEHKENTNPVSPGSVQKLVQQIDAKISRKKLAPKSEPKNVATPFK